MDLEKMILAYLDALAWSEGFDQDPSKGLKIRARVICKSFLDKAEPILLETDYTSEQAGHDLYFTQHRHGVGFWEGDHCTIKQGQGLTDLAHTLKEISPFIHKNQIFI